MSSYVAQKQNRGLHSPVQPLTLDLKDIVISLTGPSGVGKSTIMDRLREACPSSQWMRSVTTRPARDTDCEGEYEYINPAEFAERAEAGLFAWCGEIHGNKYGHEKAVVMQAATSAFPHCLHMAPKYVPKLRRAIPGKVLSVFVFVEDPKKLEQRLRGRDQHAPFEEIQRRMQECLKWGVQAERSGIPYLFLSNDEPLDRTMIELTTHLQNPHPSLL